MIQQEQRAMAMGFRNHCFRYSGLFTRSPLGPYFVHWGSMGWDFGPLYSPHRQWPSLVTNLAGEAHGVVRWLYHQLLPVGLSDACKTSSIIDTQLPSLCTALNQLLSVVRPYRWRFLLLQSLAPVLFSLEFYLPLWNFPRKLGARGPNLGTRYPASISTGTPPFQSVYHYAVAGVFRYLRIWAAARVAGTRWGRSSFMINRFVTIPSLTIPALSFKNLNAVTIRVMV